MAAGHADAVAAGIRLLKQGGNAADAAAATLFALAVTDYGMFAIGGEIPLLIYDAKGREVKSLSGVGRAPLDPQAIAWLYAHGIPSKGSMKAAPAPGAVDLCITLLRLYGTRSYAEAVAPTLELLDAHEKPWHADLAVTLRKLAEAERLAPGTREEKLVAARDRFYRGDVADELDAWYKQMGAFYANATWRHIGHWWRTRFRSTTADTPSTSAGRGRRGPCSARPCGFWKASISGAWGDCRPTTSMP